ncbi:hypothetical protein V5799_018110 [Amblyomma americanum]|uniref:Single domain-containing protein n=1 Tax=Amblyomma americanum TaxID=6943 RepID=A0AAQ4F0E8_AMBAM
MHALATTVSAFMALAILYCKTSEGRPELIYQPNTCEYDGQELLSGSSITLNETCVKISCLRGTLKREQCPFLDLNDPLCGSEKGPGTEFPDCCPVYYCEHRVSSEH